MGVVRGFFAAVVAWGLFLAGCGANDGPDIKGQSGSTVPAAGEQQREIINVGISLYLLVDDKQDPDPALSTRRTEEELLAILDAMNDIWSQASIRLELESIGTLEVPEAALRAVSAGNIRAFFEELGGRVESPQPAATNGFYIRRLGGPNGISVSRLRSYFVIDEPSVFDRRVSSHEVGHRLGLQHVLNDRDRLLYSGTNGMRLTEDEAEVARQGARQLIETVQ